MRVITSPIAIVLFEMAALSSRSADRTSAAQTSPGVPSPQGQPPAAPRGGGPQIVWSPKVLALLAHAFEAQTAR